MDYGSLSLSYGTTLYQYFPVAISGLILTLIFGIVLLMALCFGGMGLSDNSNIGIWESILVIFYVLLMLSVVFVIMLVTLYGVYFFSSRGYIIVSWIMMILLIVFFYYYFGAFYGVSKYKFGTNK